MKILLVVGVDLEQFFVMCREKKKKKHKRIKGHGKEGEVF
jgi:hypothetical protein